MPTAPAGYRCHTHAGARLRSPNPERDRGDTGAAPFIGDPGKLPVPQEVNILRRFVSVPFWLFGGAPVRFPPNSAPVCERLVLGCPQASPVQCYVEGPIPFCLLHPQPRAFRHPVPPHIARN